MKYLAFKLPGLEPLHNDVPLTGVTITRAHNTALVLEGTIAQATAYEQINIEGTSQTVELIRERGTLLVSWDGHKADSFIVDAAEEHSEEQDSLVIQAFGHGTLPDGTPWTANARNYIEEDPLNIVRDLWDHTTSFPNVTNVQVDSTRSPVRVGEEEREVEFTTGDGTEVAFDTGPFRVNWWSTTDMGRVFADLAVETPFQWREETVIDMDSDTAPRFRIRLGYPRLESVDRSESHRFEVGFNVTAPEQDTDDEDSFFDEVYVLGNGDGSEKRRGHQRRGDNDRLRTVRVIEDQGIRSNRLADETARQALGLGHEEKFWETITVLPHKSARPGTYDVGDIITVSGTTVWGEHVQRSRITQLVHTVADDRITLTLERV